MTLSSLYFPVFKLFCSKHITFSYSVHCGHLVLNVNQLFTGSLASSFHYYLKYFIFHTVSKAALQIKATVILDKILYYEFLNYSSDFVFSTTLPNPFSPAAVIKKKKTKLSTASETSALNLLFPSNIFLPIPSFCFIQGFAPLSPAWRLSLNALSKHYSCLSLFPFFIQFLK